MPPQTQETHDPLQRDSVAPPYGLVSCSRSSWRSVSRCRRIFRISVFFFMAISFEQSRRKCQGLGGPGQRHAGCADRCDRCPAKRREADRWDRCSAPFGWHLSAGGHRLVRDGSAYFIHDWEERPDEGDVEELSLDEEGLLVADIMNPKIYSVREDATVPEVASMMLKGHIHRLLVTREDRAVGVITTSDLLGLLVGED